MTKKLLKNKRILITGAMGFVGSHLCRRLKQLGATVFGISRKEQSDMYYIDISDHKKMLAFMKKHHVTSIVHLAGESLVETGQNSPYRTFKTNIDGTLNILECSRELGLEKIIIASTSHVYGKNRLPYYEGYTPRPSRPYETSKACADLIAQSYAYYFDLPVIIPRFVNIYGPGDLHFTRIIPKIMKAACTENDLVIWGDDTTFREYLYIDDAIEAYVLLLTVDLKKVGENRIFNFGSGDKLSVLDLIEKVKQISGKNSQIKKVKEGREGEIISQYVSSLKAKNTLHWRPTVSLKDGIRKTYTWYSDYFSNSALI